VQDDVWGNAVLLKEANAISVELKKKVNNLCPFQRRVVHVVVTSRSCLVYICCEQTMSSRRRSRVRVPQSCCQQSSQLTFVDEERLEIQLHWLISAFFCSSVFYLKDFLADRQTDRLTDIRLAASFPRQPGTSFQTDNHASTSSIIFTCHMLFLTPIQRGVEALKALQIFL